MSQISKKLLITSVALAMPFATFAQVPGNTDMRPERAQIMPQPNANAELRANAAARVASSTAQWGDRILQAKNRAEEEVQRRVEGLQKLLERITAMKRVSDTFKGELRATVDAQIQNIEALGLRIAEGISTSTLKEDILSITRSYRIFALVMPQANIAAAADRMATITATMSEIGAKLQTRIEAAEAAGHDVSALEAALLSLSDHIDSANAHAEAAIEGTADLEPDNGNTVVAEANRAALQAAREELRLAHEEVQAGREDIRTIIDGLKGLQTPDVSAETTTTAETQ